MRSGDLARAGGWLLDSGRQSLALGALATAAVSLKSAADLLAGSPEQDKAELELVAALALAGRVDEAAAAGGRLITRLGGRPETAGDRVEAHLRVAQAAIAASRWRMARYQLEEASAVVGGTLSPAQTARRAVLQADVAMAGDDYDAARRGAAEVLASSAAPADSRCHALEIIGRSHRSSDLAAARAAFEEALATAETADLPLWRLRALHEVGTIDLFDHAGLDRLLQARHLAEQMGAMSTAAILDLQLAAGYTCRWELERCDAHATSALTIAEPLGLHQVAGKGLMLLGAAASMRADFQEMERLCALAMSAAPEDRMLDGMYWGSRGLGLLVAGRTDEALDPYARGIAILDGLPHGEPAALRALWPLVLAATADRRARAAIDAARRRGIAAFKMNAGLIDYAEAVIAGREGDVRRAGELVARADVGFLPNCLAWLDLARTIAAPVCADWADLKAWLPNAKTRFAGLGLPAMEALAEEVLRTHQPNPWSGAGVSTREADVLRLLAEGLSNKDVATRLQLSPRTVEKHVESLLRKTGARSRTELVMRLVPAATREPNSTT